MLQWVLRGTVPTPYSSVVWERGEEEILGAGKLVSLKIVKQAQLMTALEISVKEAQKAGVILSLKQKNATNRSVAP